MTDGLTQFPFVPGSESDIDSLGESIANIGEALLSTQIASASAGNIPSDWLSNASDAYASSMVSYQGQLIDLSGDFSPVQTVINSYRSLFTTTNTRTGQLQDDWDTAHQDFRTEKAELDALAETLTQADYDTHLQDLVQSRDLHLSELNESYSQALEDLNEEVQTQANTILSHLDSIISPEARLAGRVAVSTELFKDIPLLDGANEFAYFEPYAEEAAALLEEPLTLETTAEFNEKYGDLIENPFFANHLIEKLGPEQLANILPQLDDMMELADGNTGLDGAGEPDTFDPSEINELATGIGSVMVLGTGGTNVADPASAEAFDTVKDRLVFSGGRSLVAEQALTRELLMEYGNTVLNAPEEPDAEWDPYYGKHGYDYFITAMGAATTANDGLIVGEEFLLGNGNPGSSMAQDMLAWEKEYGGSRLEDPSRGPWASSTNTSLFGQARVANGYINAGQTLARLMDSVTVDQNGPHAEWAMQENEARADVVRTFLAGDTEFLDENMKLARYMTGHRELGFEWTDGGEIFSNILLEASDPALDEVPVEPGPDASQAEWDAFEAAKEAWLEDNREAGVVAPGFAEGYQDGLNDSAGVEGESGFAFRSGEEHYGTHNAEIRAVADEILAPYSDDISESFMQRYGSHAVIEGENWADGHVIQLTDDMIEDFMGNTSIFRDMARDEVAGGPNSIEVFSEAVNEAMRLDVEETIRNGGSLDDIAQTAARHVPLLHTSLMAETMTDVEIQEACDIRMRAIETVAGKVGGRFTEVPGGGFVIGEMISYIIPDDFGEGMTSEIRAQQEVVRQMLHEEIYAATWNTRDEGTWIEAFDTSNVDIMDPIEHFIYAEEHGAFPGQEDFYKSMIDENGEMLPWDELGPEQQQAFYDYLEYYGLVGESPILTSGDAGGSQEWEPYEYREDGQADAPVNNPAGASNEEFDPMDEVFGDPYPIEEEPEDNG